MRYLCNLNNDEELLTGATSCQSRQTGCVQQTICLICVLQVITSETLPFDPQPVKYKPTLLSHILLLQKIPLDDLGV